MAVVRGKANSLINDGKKKSEKLISEAKVKVDNLLAEAEKILDDAKSKTKDYDRNGQNFLDKQPYPEPPKHSFHQSQFYRWVTGYNDIHFVVHQKIQGFFISW